MAAEHGGEAPQNYEPGYSPYGLAGQRAGELACILQLRLIAPDEPLAYGPNDMPRWTDDDRLAFGYLLDFDGSLLALDRATGTPSVRDRFPELRVFDVAHPYGGALWEWIKGARDAAWSVTPDEAYELVKRGGSFPYEEQLSRLWQADSNELIHMWTTWRRALAPHDDPHFHQDVREGLDTIIAHVLPNRPRP